MSIYSGLPNELIMRIIEESTQEKRHHDNMSSSLKSIGVFENDSTSYARYLKMCRFAKLCGDATNFQYSHYVAESIYSKSKHNAFPSGTDWTKDHY